MMIHAPRCAFRLFREPANTDSAGRALTLMLAPGMRGRLFRARELTDGLPVGNAMVDLRSSSGTAAGLFGPGQPARGPARTAGLEPPGHQVGAEAGHGRSRYGLEPGVRDGPATSPGDPGRFKRSKPEFGSIYHLVRVGVGICVPGRGRRQRSGDLTRVGGRHSRLVDG